MDEAKLIKRRESEYAKLDAMLLVAAESNNTFKSSHGGYHELWVQYLVRARDETKLKSADLKCILDMRKPFSQSMVVRVLTGSQESRRSA